LCLFEAKIEAASPPKTAVIIPIIGTEESELPKDVTAKAIERGIFIIATANAACQFAFSSTKIFFILKSIEQYYTLNIINNEKNKKFK
jgi:hypothetical protein